MLILLKQLHECFIIHDFSPPEKRKFPHKQGNRLYLLKRARTAPKASKIRGRDTLESGHGLEKRMEFFQFSPYFAKSRYRKVTMWPRVQTSLGEKVVRDVPLVIPFSTAQFTAWA